MKYSLIRMIFRRYRKIMIALVLIGAAVVALLCGTYNAWQSLDVSMNKYISEYGIGDAVIATDITDVSAADILRRVKGVSLVIARLTGSTQMITSSGETKTVQIISMDREDILQLYHWKDADQVSGDYVLVDRWFADNNGIYAGEILQFRTGETEYRPFTVAGIVSAPETLEKTKLELGGKTYPDFGFLYAPISLLAQETEKEYRRMTAEWEEKEQEYQVAEQELRAGWTEGLRELDAAWKELETQENEYSQKRAELQEQLRQLTDGRIQLTLGLKQLQDAEKTAEENRVQLEQLHERITGQMAELEDRMADLKEARNNLSSLLVRVEDARGRLYQAREQIASGQEQLQSVISLLNSAKSSWNIIQSMDADVKLPEATQSALSQAEQILAAQSISIANLDSWSAQAESGLAQLNTGAGLVQKGISQISQIYLPEIQNYLEQTEQGLELLAETHDALRDTVAETEAGLRSIDEFEREAPENREEIEAKLQEVKDGILAIYSGLEEGEAALTEGRRQLEEKNAKAETAHAEAEAELAEGAKSLREAWEKISSWEGYTPLRNEFLLWFEKDAGDPREILKEAEAVLEVPVRSSVLYDDSQVVRIINANLEPLEKLYRLVSMVFVSIMMMVMLLFLSIMIRQSRQHIGILRALGFSRGTVRRSFSVVCVLMMLLASALGGGGSVVITVIFNEAFQRFYSLPEYLRTFSWPVLAVTSAVMILLSVGSVALSAGSLNRIQPAEAISRPTAPAPKIGRLARFLLRRVGPLSKFSLLSLKRTPFRFFSSVVCLGGAVSIMFASLSFLVAKNDVIIQAFERFMHYNGQVVFAAEPAETLEEEIRGMAEVSALERYWASEQEISFGEKIDRTTLIFLEPGTTMISLMDLPGNPLAYPTEGIMLNSGFAKNIGAAPGDVVTIAGRAYTVTGIARQTLNFQFMPASARTDFADEVQTGWMVRLREGSDGAALSARMSREDGYVTTLWKSLMRKGIEDLYVHYDLYAWVLIILCGMVGAFIVVNTGRNNLNEQKLSLSVLRAMGFQHRDISLRWFLQSFLFYLFSLAVGLPVGRVMADICLDMLRTAERDVRYIHSLFQYAWTAGLIFAFLVAAHLITVRVMRKWDLVENLKGRE